MHHATSRNLTQAQMRGWLLEWVDVERGSPQTRATRPRPPKKEERIVMNMVSKEDRTWGLLLHLSGLAGFVFPFGNLIAPLVLWLIRRDRSSFLDDQGCEALNFQIAFTIYAILSGGLILVLIGFLLLPVVLITGIVLMVKAAIRANEGTYFRYPLIFRLVKPSV
jgi:uncharacterized Tic20 family protein